MEVRQWRWDSVKITLVEESRVILERAETGSKETY